MSYEEYLFSESASRFSSSYIKPQLCTSQEASVLTNTPGLNDAKKKKEDNTTAVDARPSLS